ncbi:ATP-binding protein [Roseimaritima ulvae]|uniref:histidine kinase n=1 Tax=Roseimaritima ulvae TaxID=980254 RepID=A0A5B9QWR9_9BACT|nr:ATP-binding protein [Roseimaritima ulvae]QEG41556.1 Sensor histidine kinase RegB [Roseimaritima ulvae]
MSTQTWPVSLFLSPRLGTSIWLLQLRWMAVLGQLITVAAAWGLLEFGLPLGPLLGLIALTACTNLGYGLWLRKIRRRATEGDSSGSATWSGSPLAAHRVASGLMLLDIGTLTAMLFFSGGATNPFALFFFVNLAVGGVILRPLWAWSLTALAILGYSLLLRYFYPIPALTLRDSPLEHSVTTIGVLVAFATCAIVITFFVTQTAGELTRQQEQLRKAEQEQRRHRQLEGLTTLAAGAAHELATPLSTIDVVVRELQRHLEECQTPPSVKQDLQLIDSELESCRQILVRMRAAAGDQTGQSWDRTTVEDLIDATLEGVRDPHRVDVVDGPVTVEQQALWLPQEAVAQAIRNLIHNGLDAAGVDGRVQISTRLDDGSVVLEISDNGSGMSEHILGRIGEPFFTTKEPGRGMGLGLYLTRNVISRLGGRMEFKSHTNQGTTVSVRLPIADSTA